MGLGFNPLGPPFDLVGASPTPAALTRVDDTNVTLVLGGTPATALLQATSLTLGWSGQLSVARGGTGISSFGAGVATWLGTPSSANLRGALTDETGTGVAVFNDTPTLIAPLLGTPTSGTLTNCTIPIGGVTGLGAGVATFLATPSSANLLAAVTDETGTGVLVFATSPTFTTDIRTPLIYGGTGASGTLQLQSTTNATRGTVETVDLVKIATANQTFGAGVNPIFIDVATGTTSLNSGAATALRFAPTITVGAASTVSVASLFDAVATVKDDGTARAIGPALLLASHFTFTATVAGDTLVDFAGVIPAHAAVCHFPTFNRTGAGTGTATTVVGLHMSSLGTVGTGWTVTNYDGVLCENPTVTGTITTTSGVRSKLTAATGRYFLNDTGGAQSLLTGPVGFGVAAATDTAAVFVAGTTAKSSLRIPHGAAPTSPVNGDMWTTTAGLFVRINGATVGPLS